MIKAFQYTNIPFNEQEWSIVKTKIFPFQLHKLNPTKVSNILSLLVHLDNQESQEMFEVIKEPVDQIIKRLVARTQKF